MALTDDQITAKNFKEFYQQILPYLGKDKIPSVGIGGGYAPIGTIISYMGVTAPQDYLICNGATYNIADYKQLADFFLLQFGSYNYFGGNGTTTFAVPDLRGEFLRGTGTNTHANQGSGANVGTHQDGTRHPRIRALSDDTLRFEHTKSQDAPGDTYDCSLISTSTTMIQVTSSSKTDFSSERTVGFTSRPTNTSVLYCIKAVCAGEVYSTDERVVGTWIDGKPIYQKTVKFENQTLAYDKQYTLAENVDFLVDNVFAPVMVESNSNTYKQPRNIPYLGTLNSNYYIDGYFVDLLTTNNVLKYQFQLGTNQADNKKYDLYFTIRYTKTTD